jgi:putative transposase
MPGPQPQTITLSSAQQTLLQSLIRQSTCPQALVLRARIILGAASGQRNETLAQRLGCSVPTIRKWRRRWSEAEAQLTAVDQRPRELQSLVASILADAPRAGAPSSFTAVQITRIADLATMASEPSPSELSPSEPPTLRALADEAVRQGIVPAISARSVGRFIRRRRPPE